MYKYIQLKNGVKIALFAMQGVKSVSLKAMISAGPVFEDDKTNGGSHFIEHIVLGGTKSYPSKLEFANILEDLGVSYGGYTSTQEMGFEFDIPYTNLFPTLDILQEILFEPSFSAEIIEKERGVILEEMQDRDNSPDFQFFLKTIEMRFHQKNHGLTRKVIGTREVLETITREQLLSLYKRLFVPSNLYVCIVGNINIPEVEEYIDKLFGNIDRTPEFTRPVFTVSELSGQVQYALEDTKFSNIYSNISFRGYPRNIPTKKELSLRMFSAMLTGLRTSRLFQDVREKEGLVYNIASDWYSSWGVGAFNISFESDASKVNRIMEIIYEDIEQIRQNGFRGEELEHTKNYFNNRTLLSFSSPGKINQWIMDYLYENEKIEFPEDLIAIGNTISHEDIMQVVTDLFDFSSMNIVMMGKLDGYDLQKTMRGINKKYSLISVPQVVGQEKS